MPLFHFKAATTSGEVIEGEMEAGNQDAVIKRLQAMQSHPDRPLEKLIRDEGVD